MLTEGCQCGAVCYSFAAVPSRVSVCHCTECRPQAYSAVGSSVMVSPAAMHLTRGAPRVRSRRTASGKVLACAFCPDCGSRIRHLNAPAGDDISIKGGLLDVPVDLTAAWHIRTPSKLPGVVMPPGIPQFPQDHD